MRWALPIRVPQNMHIRYKILIFKKSKVYKTKLYIYNIIFASFINQNKMLLNYL